MDSTNDMNDLVTRAVNGDAYSFELLYQQSYRVVYFTCISFLKNEQDALDITQDVYLTAFQYLSMLEDRSKFMPWLTRIAVNKCKNYLNQKRPVPMDEETLANLMTEENENFLPEEYVTNHAKRRLVMDIMQNCLSETLYQTVILYYFDYLSVAEIAEFMECPVGTVTYRLSVARAKIKAGVQQYEKQNDDKLYSVAVVPFLTSLLMYEMQNMYIPYAAPAFLGISGAASGLGAEGISGAASGLGAEGISGAANIPGTIMNPDVSGTVPNIMGKKIAEKGAKVMFRTAKAKIAAGIVSVAVVGGVAAGIIITHKDADNSKSAKETATKTTTEDFMTDEAENVKENEDVFADNKEDEASTEITETTETSESEETTEELTEETPQLADNEILCDNDFDKPCSKITVTMPEEYRVSEKRDNGYIGYESDNGNYIDVYCYESAEQYIDFEIGQANLRRDDEDELSSETGSIINDVGLEFLWLKEEEIDYPVQNYQNTLVFAANLPTHNDRECCIVVRIYNFDDGAELLPEEFSNLVSSSAIKIEKYE